MEATLEAVQRSTRGKNEARRLRVAGQIPAVVYGAQKDGDAVDALPISVDPKPLFKILHSESGANTLITLKVEGVGDSRVLVKEFLLDPISHKMLHADFFRVNMDRPIAVTVPVVLRGEPKGVKLQNGILDFLHREIELECLPGTIPDAIEIDVSEMLVGQGVYVRDVAANATWTPVSDPDLMLVHVIAQRVAETAAEGAAAEPEVAKKGKPEKEEAKK
ncbi:MAG: 50S ribosomal protein L25 [Vicinamibacterales bacterium]